jgi:hypothetical protein
MLRPSVLEVVLTTFIAANQMSILSHYFPVLFQFFLVSSHDSEFPEMLCLITMGPKAN